MGSGKRWLRVICACAMLCVFATLLAAAAENPETRTVESLLKRINHLARKSKQEGLTEAEKEEQAVLRKEYIENFREQFKGHLKRVKFVEDLSEEELVKIQKENEEIRRANEKAQRESEHLEQSSEQLEEKAEKIYDKNRQN